MRIRKLFPLAFVAVFAVASLPETASAQRQKLSECVRCAVCEFESGREDRGEMCVGREGFIGHRNCIQYEEPCTCFSWGLGFCRFDLPFEEQNAELTETLAAIRAGESIPADGPFFYARRGDDFVVRRKCGAAEVARVAIADIASAPVPLAG